MELTMETLRITALKPLKTLCRSFAAGKLPAVMLVGPPGQYKTQSLLNALKKRRHLYLRGRVSALSLYEQLYQHRDELVILDDTAEMLKDRNVQEMLRDLTESTESRQVSWRTQSSILADKGLPTSFYTKSPLCVVANKLGTDGVWPALNSRCLRWEIGLSWAELIKQVRRDRWFHDEEILAFAEHEARCRADVRLLKKAKSLKDLNLIDWRALFGQKVEPTRPVVDRQRLIGDIQAQPGISLTVLHRILGNNVSGSVLRAALGQLIGEGLIREQKRKSGGRCATTFWPIGGDAGHPQPAERTKLEAAMGAMGLEPDVAPAGNESGQERLEPADTAASLGNLNAVA
jgi:hypothetical protein